MMTMLIYFFMSIFGVYLTHKASLPYTKNNKALYFILWAIVYVFFNAQQYSMFFDKEVLSYWFFPLSDTSFEINGWIQANALFFLIINTATIPPSKVGRWFRISKGLLFPNRN